MAEYAALREEAQGTGAKIFFVDPTHFRADAELLGKWVLKGGRPWWTRPFPNTVRRPAIALRCAWRRAGARPRESGGGMDGTGGEQQLRRPGCLPPAAEGKAPGPLRVIWDNAPAHRGESLRKYLSTPGLGLRLVNLPGYSPEFNADEAIWGWAREEATGNLSLRTRTAVQQRVSAFLAGLSSRREEVKRRCRTVLQSRAEALLRGSQPDSRRPANAHPTLALV